MKQRRLSTGTKTIACIYPSFLIRELHNYSLALLHSSYKTSACFLHLSWFHSYFWLTESKQNVQTVLIIFRPLFCHDLQGSVLRPILFVLYATPVCDSHPLNIVAVLLSALLMTLTFISQSTRTAQILREQLAGSPQNSLGKLQRFITCAAAVNL